MKFPTDIDQILANVHAIDPVTYGYNRNFLDGAVSKLSPYISRGFISTKIVYESLVKRGFELDKIEKFVQELAWRDYWQLQWKHYGYNIDKDLKTIQVGFLHQKMITNISLAKTKISAIDKAILEFFDTGYMHNHARMYVAAMACNVGKAHWHIPAKWMYYHLLDADWGSNALSWQWVAGTNSHKKYIANQENINKYSRVEQLSTYLDVSYDFLSKMDCPAELETVSDLNLVSHYPIAMSIEINQLLPTLIYTPYNLDPTWRNTKEANRILFLDTVILERYPMSKKTIDFVTALAQNIPNIQLFVGTFESIKANLGNSQLFYKEHPFSSHYEGIADERDWLFYSPTAPNSFFTYWKKCKKNLQSFHNDYPTLFSPYE